MRSFYGNMFENKSVIAANSGTVVNCYGSINIMESMLDFTFEYSVLENNYITESTELSILGENAIKTIWSKIKQVLQWLWEQIKKLSTFIANFVKNLFSRNKQNEAKAKIIREEIKKKDQNIVKDTGNTIKQEIKAIEAKFNYNKNNNGSDEMTSNSTDNKNLPAVIKNSDDYKKSIIDKLKKFTTNFDFANLFPRPDDEEFGKRFRLTPASIHDMFMIIYDMNDIDKNPQKDTSFDIDYITIDYVEKSNGYRGPDLKHFYSQISRSYVFNPEHLKFKGKRPTEEEPFAATISEWIDALDDAMNDASKKYCSSFNWDPFDKEYLDKLSKSSDLLKDDIAIFNKYSMPAYKNGVDKFKEVINKNESVFTYYADNDPNKKTRYSVKFSIERSKEMIKLYTINLDLIKHVNNRYNKAFNNITKLHNLALTLIKSIPNSVTV